MNHTPRPQVFLDKKQIAGIQPCHDHRIGVGYRIAFRYYPWTCPETGIVGWTIEPAGDDGFFVRNSPDCDTFVRNQSAFLPSDVDSIKQVFELLGDCGDFGVDPASCIGPEQTNQSPYWDDIRIGIAQSVNAPQLEVDLFYQDCYPSANSLVATETARVRYLP